MLKLHVQNISFKIKKIVDIIDYDALVIVPMETLGFGLLANELEHFN